MSFRIFISYSHASGAPSAFHLHENLQRALPGATIWIDRDLPPGIRFRDELMGRVKACDYFLAIVDKNWLADLDEKRSTGAEIFLESEIKWALESGRKVIPVLIDDARMPAADRLPPALRAFAGFHAIRVSSSDFPDAVSRLIQGAFRQGGRSSQLEYKDHEFVRDKGWSFVELAERLKDLDFRMIENVTEEDEAPPEELGPIFDEFTQTWRLIVRQDEEIVGYWRFVPLLPEKYRRAQSGELMDKELTRDAMRGFDTSDTYDVYIAAMGILTKYKEKGKRLLIESFLNVLVELAEDDRYLGRVCANGLSFSGNRLCDSLNMKPITNRGDSGTIFEAQMIDILKHIFSNNRYFAARYGKLVDQYSNRPSMAHA